MRVKVFDWKNCKEELKKNVACVAWGKEYIFTDAAIRIIEAHMQEMVEVKVRLMSNEQNFLKDKFERLKEELIENLINTPDSEILNEVKEDYGDSSFIANKVREIMKNSQIKAGKSKLRAAKEELQKLDNKSPEITIEYKKSIEGVNISN